MLSLPSLSGTCAVESMPGETTAKHCVDDHLSHAAGVRSHLRARRELRKREGLFSETVLAGHRDRCILWCGELQSEYPKLKRMDKTDWLSANMKALRVNKTKCPT